MRKDVLFKWAALFTATHSLMLLPYWLPYLLRVWEP